MTSKKDKYKRFITFLSALLLLGVLTGVFAYIWYKYYSDAIVLPYYRRGNWVLIGIYCIITALFFKAYGGFKLGYLKKTDMLYSQLLSMLCVNVISYFMVSLIGRKFMDATPFLIMTAIDLVVITLWTVCMGRLIFIIYPPRRLVILYGSQQAAALVMKMSQRVDKYMICESVSIHEPPEVIREHILRYEGVIICDIPAEQRNDCLKFCFEHSVRAYIAPKISDIIVRGADDIRLFDTPLLLCRNYGLDFEQQFVKRAFDIVFSAVLLLLISPLMLIISAAIKLGDGGPVFFRQKRLTLGGKEFDVYKFRSMIVNAEADGGPQLAEKDDPRITPVGHFLRKTRLDELPQLLNILKGDMSVVGPRPERPELTEEYRKEMPEFGFRLKVKAGLTGYAQVTGAYDTTPYDKLKMDLMYIERYSFRMDIQIILMTIKTMFFPGAAGSESASVHLPAGENGNEDKHE
ncbi:MAG: exopolysaccharide biosynthesis polyprenyl glycosylphosphotransferase [Ruminococcus sp.]|nr:exopolysaccharide biosynthesis polyprenyl glycosylphosphotransferase [Ruminococcus sp.]